LIDRRSLGTSVDRAVPRSGRRTSDCLISGESGGRPALAIIRPVPAADFRIDRARVAREPPGEAAWRAIESIYDELKTPYEPDNRFDELTEGQRALYVLHWVQSEVRNGGFAQMYANSAGRFAALAPGAATLIGACEQRQHLLAQVVAKQTNAVEGLEEEFFDLLRHGDIYDQMGQFVFERPADFFVN
jgi:hypothetical protein